MKTLNITFDFEIDNIKSLGCFVGFIMGLKTMPTENDSFNQFNKNLSTALLKSLSIILPEDDLTLMFLDAKKLIDENPEDFLKYITAEIKDKFL